MLLTLKEILTPAYTHKFAIPAFNIGNFEIAKTVLEQCTESQSPCILAIHPTELDYVTEGFIEYLKYEAQNSTIPFTIHLDHGASIDQIKRAVSCGFTSVMIDASRESFQENVAITKEVVQFAHQHNVSVESELGTIGNIGDSMEGGSTEIYFTDPDQAQDFIAQTQIDALAVAVGTLHGIYPKDFQAQIQLDRLKQIAQKTTIPLVLHGGSSNSDDEIREAIKLGVCKINISSDVKNGLFREATAYLINNKNALEPSFIFKDAVLKAKQIVKHKLEVFNCIKKADLYQ